LSGDTGPPDLHVALPVRCMSESGREIVGKYSWCVEPRMIMIMIMIMMMIINFVYQDANDNLFNIYNVDFIGIDDNDT
jgi:hypothetical protein